MPDHGLSVPAKERTPACMLQQLTDCLTELQIRCTACEGPLTCLSVPTTEETSVVALVPAHCRACQRDQSAELSFEQLRSCLFNLGD